MKTNIVILASIILFFSGCKKTSVDTKKEEVLTDTSSVMQVKPADTIKVKNDKVVIPNFKIVVNLSDAAVKKLQSGKESIIASLFFYGNTADEKTLPPAIKKEIGPNGLKLGDFKIEDKDVHQSNEIEVKNISIPKKLYDFIVDKKIFLNINVFSGRRAFKDNLLDMEFFDSELNEITSKGNVINLNGRLISESE
ncbi:hypothetical protein CMU59_02575 [Elizabethkingia anophelis]|uniref:Lipoprotein n=1 Tax=Elizabethkingia anophelis TaxID=1117645 RepID=A0A455ZDQ4_9FLAO|nr:hypothetical protein [Elizabethkingia anophelis]AQW91578.1 hypothetical protein BBD28_13375 [Elizabethkingia anophelis]KUY18535.1 hypothetical protein ATB94_03530 [Elizabethkingia anophelis]MCT3897127.1 hypothetical protein [Elizabethkingia anophelis]MCT3992085.1 hypothetical protein [Elizabethkingia anophelis]MCT4010088.1 hypothetical protein [Elizabethkingia anophelis]